MNCKYLDTDMLNEFYGISRSYQQKLRSKGLIPYLKVGNKILYKAIEIEQWLSAHYVVNIDKGEIDG